MPILDSCFEPSSRPTYASLSERAILVAASSNARDSTHAAPFSIRAFVFTADAIEVAETGSNTFTSP